MTTGTINPIPAVGDYAGWAARFLETCRQQQRDAVSMIQDVSGYAEAVREEAAAEVARWGADPNLIRQRTGLATGTITHWRNEAGHLANGGLVAPPQPTFLAEMFRDVRTTQLRAAVQEAGYQADRAYGADDPEQLTRWRNSEAAFRGLLAEAELDPEQERSHWVQLATEFSDEVAGWAKERGWKVSVKELPRSEELLGAYEVPMLIIQTERGAVMMEPVARVVQGAAGRIDLYAYPTLFRVRLLKSLEGEGWRIRTDSGVFLPQRWSKETFVSLVQDLTTAS